VRTPFCDLLGIDALAPFGPWEQVEVAAAVCQAGGLGSFGTAVRTVEELRSQGDRALTRLPQAFVFTIDFGS
jgi:nitronate monooxygenase/enoyl-[acyl-carrier protein] reductase II